MPWYPVDPDKATWPLIPGTKEPVLRFRWDESWEHDDNFYSIQMIIAHMKRHGTVFMPAAASALAVISEDDFQRRVVDKFVGLQKGLRQAKILDSNNKRIVMAAVTEAISGDDDGPYTKKTAPENKPRIKAILASRAKGVRVMFHPSNLSI
jgi:hypothetical protein